MPKVAVALSGGLDSSVTAYLLLKQGYEVVGVTGKMTCSKSADTVAQNAKAVADFLGIEHYVVDVSEKFEDKVINYFEESYRSGQTPNPCISCNKNIKWGALMDFAIDELGADFFATGHYANIQNDNGVHKLYPAKDLNKDQLYFLFALNQEQLSRTMFPLYDYEKSQIRQIAIEKNLPSKSSKESQDICFIQKPMTTKKYLEEKLSIQKGDFIEYSTGKKLGTHNGHYNYTIGQRKGIGIAASQPLYVVDIDGLNNIVYVGVKQDTERQSLILNDFNKSYPFDDEEFSAKVKIRYNMQAVNANVKFGDKVVTIDFIDPVNSIAKGQACVIYDANDGHLLGGSFI